jgi:hypothetical protein
MSAVWRVVMASTEARERIRTLLYVPPFNIIWWKASMSDAVENIPAAGHA